MRFYITAAVVLALIFALPYIRCAVKRVTLFIKLKILCAKNNAKLYLVSPFSLFAFNHGKGCDMYIETQYEILSIKLFGITGHLAHLIFHDERKYTVKKMLPLFGRWGTTMNLSFQSKETLLPLFNFTKKFKASWNYKTLRKILLLNPSPFEVESTMAAGGARYMGDGDYLYNNIELFSYRGLKNRVLNK